MHKYLFSLILICLSNAVLVAQFDIKLDPVAALLARNVKGGIEVGITKQFSIDVDGTYSSSVSLPFKNINFTQAKSSGIRVMGKYYPYANFGTDGLFVAPYLKYRYSRSPLYKHTRVAMGLMTGYKLLTSRKLYFEVAGGLGFRVHASLRDSTGDYLDGLIGSNFFGSIYDFFADSIGKYDISTRIVIGYRLSGNAPLKKLKDIPIALQ